jgi:hypothetical protein
MSLATLLVRSFQVWLKSPAAGQALVQAERALAPQLAKVGAKMAGDTLAISGKAAAQAATRAASRTAGRVATQAASKAVTQTAAKTVTQAASKTATQAAGEVAEVAGKRVMSQGEKLIAARRVAMNRIAGDRREMMVSRFLNNRFPAAQGYKVHPEQYLRNSLGQIAREAKTGQARRLDFVVFQGDKAISTIEVTSKQASKVAQAAKELRIREAGGRYLLNPETGKLVKLAADQATDTLRLF